MGEVWRAHDTRLGREVAIKILPAEVSGDPVRRARFEQEARAAGTLNHPGIVAIYDISSADGVLFLVTELVDGQTLRTVLREGPLGPRKALDLGAQVADAIAFAHGSRIVHRDLKPENIMVTRNGRAKILDFGLAKPIGKTANTESAIETLALTQDGVTMGTPGYMSPEQVRGVPADHRSDIFSFGLVLYEMLSGRRAFHTETSAETLTAILRSEPPELPAGISPAVRQAVWHCIEKEPGNRFQSANDLAFALRNLGGVSTESQAVAPVATARRRPNLWLVSMLAAALVLGAVAMLLLVPGDRESVADNLRFIPFATDPEMEAFPSFSPDGKSIAYNKEFQIFVRSLDAAVPTQLTQPPMRFTPAFWSADGTHVYFTNTAVGTGAPVGETWLWSISSAGGTPSRVLDKCESAIRSPDGKTVVFLRVEKDGRRRLYTSSPPGAEPRPMPESSLPLGAFSRLNGFAPDGTKFIVTSISADTQIQEVWMVRFPTGTPTRLRQLEPATAAYWFPDSRHVLLLSWFPGRAFQVLLADTRSGARHNVFRGPETVISGDLSADGRQFVYSTGYPDWDIVEFGTDGKQRGNLVATSRIEGSPNWSPKGDQLVYMTDIVGPLELWIRSADGQKTAPLVRAASLTSIPTGPRFSRDGRRVGYITGDQVWVVPASGGQSIPVFKSEHGSLGFGSSLSWSPDGEFLALCDGARILKVPSSGGVPVVVKQVHASGVCLWSPEGHSIAYSAGDGMHLLAPDGSADRLLFGRERRASSCDFTSDGRLYICAESLEAGGYRIVTWEAATAREIKSVAMDVNRSLTLLGLSLYPDGTRFATALGKIKYDLWIVEGFAQPATGLARLFHHWTAPPPAAR
jgi:serine/threonine protein kinase/WD40 repeat protein